MDENYNYFGGRGATCPTRKHLDHRGPAYVHIDGAWYFITINAAERVDLTCRSTPAGPLMPFASKILDSARYYHNIGKWRLALLLVMPDHLHLLVHVPAVDGAAALPKIIAAWKHYLSSHLGLNLQRDFFDTRMRDDEMYREKFVYICQNPVRWGLVKSARDWPHVIAFSREDGTERVHR